MDNWLEIVVGIYLLGMILYGHYKGFLRLAVSMAALVATLVIVHIAMPKIAVYVKENTPIYTWILENIQETMAEALRIDEEISMPAQQRMVIEGLSLPQDVKRMLLENNNSQMYEILGVNAFVEYIGSYLANMILNWAGFVVMFIFVSIMLRLIVKWLDIMAKLPVLSGMNKLAGAVLGGIQGLFFIWIVSLLVTACSSTPWALAILRQVEASKWLSVLYHYNLLSKIALGILKGILS